MADRIAVMEDGVLQQYGRPAELRERPANLFVATFLGEPPTNALPGTVQTGAVRLGREGEHRFALSGVDLPPDGTEIVLGVRPHHLRLGRGGWRASVVSNQWLGDQAHVVLDFTGHLLVAVAQHRVPVRAGSEVPFGFEPTDTLLFDAASGRAVLHGGRPA